MTAFRLATHEDIEKIGNFFDNYLKNDYFITHATITRMVTGYDPAEPNVKRKPIFVWLVEEERDIIGVALVGCGGTLFNFLIRPDHRRKGLGKEFLAYISPRRVRCKTDVSSGSPLLFYFNQGYTQYQTTLSGDILKEGKNQNIIVLNKTNKEP